MLPICVIWMGSRLAGLFIISVNGNERVHHATRRCGGGWRLAARAAARADAARRRVDGLCRERSCGTNAGRALRQELRELGWEEVHFRILCSLPCGGCRQGTAVVMELMKLTLDTVVSNTNFVTAAVQAEVRLTNCFHICWRSGRFRLCQYDARPNGNLTGFASWDSPAMSGNGWRRSRRSRPKSSASGS